MTILKKLVNRSRRILEMKETYPLIDYLYEHKENRAMLANLRRCLGKLNGDIAAYPYVVPFLPKQKFSDQIYFNVAGLFGLYPEFTHQELTIGKAFTKLSDTDSRNKRFKALLDAEGAAFYYHLRQAVSLLKSHEIKINFQLLLRDMLYWDHPERFVQLQWARDFWGE